MHTILIFSAGFVTGVVADAVLLTLLMRYVPYFGWNAIEARMRWDRAKQDWRGADLRRVHEEPIEVSGEVKK